MSFELHKPVSLDLKDGTSLHAFIHAEDKLAGLVSLELIPSADLALIPANNIKLISRLPHPPPQSKWPSQKRIHDMTRPHAEQDRVFRKHHDEFARIGVGVSAEGQAIFDVLAKTLPCRWDDNAIVILDTVRLAPPYDIASISGNGDSGTVQRVKIVLEREAQTIRSAAETNGVAR